MNQPAQDIDARTIAQTRQLVALGRRDEAIAILETVVRQGTRNLDLVLELVRLYTQAGRAQEAYDLGTQVLRIRPGHLDAHFQLGLAALPLHRYQDAEGHFKAVLEHNPRSIESLTNLGAVYFGVGAVRQALECFEQVRQLTPELVPVLQNYLSMLNYDEDLPLAELMAQHRTLGAVIAAQAGPRPASYANDRALERPLRVGYLSGDYLNHPAAHYIEPVFRHHDPARVQVFAYSLLPYADPITQVFRDLVPNWRDVADLSNDALFEAIQRDRIDILVDLAGHTARNRVLVVARKPAPIAVNWVGYLNSMGLEAVDYGLWDPHLLSPAAEALLTERAWKLPETAYAYAPLATPRQPAPAPWARKGHITFGCYNNPAKVSDRALDVWGRVLARLPDSTILFKYKTFTVPSVQSRVLDGLGRHGVAPERVVFEGFTPLGRYLESFAEIDLAFDSFPYTGVTTTMHTLYMGVPVVTLEGDTPVQRFGRSALVGIGRPDWIARDESDYVEVALTIVDEIRRRPELRQEIQQRMLASPLMRHQDFVRGLEDGYRAMWARWCTGDGRA